MQRVRSGLSQIKTSEIRLYSDRQYAGWRSRCPKSLSPHDLRDYRGNLPAIVDQILRD